MRPTWRAVGAALLASILFWYGATSEVPWLFLLAWLLAALIVASALYAAWNHRTLRLLMGVKANEPAPDSPWLELPASLVRTAPSRSPVFEGDAAGLLVVLHNEGAARGPAWVAGHIVGKPSTLGTGVVPRRGWRWTLRAAGLRRGPIAATGWMIAASDPLGFFNHRKTSPDLELGLVYPRFASLSHRHAVRELETVAAAPRAGSGNELFGIREYRPGDSLRRVHWRSSARRGQLIVREYEPPGVRAIRIAVDPNPPTSEVADQIARIAASEAWDCVRDGGRVALGAVESRDLWDLLEWLARYPSVDFGVPPGHADVVVTANPGDLDPNATINWLVGDAPAGADVDYARAGLAWPL